MRSQGSRICISGSRILCQTMGYGRCATSPSSTLSIHLYGQMIHGTAAREWSSLTALTSLKLVWGVTEEGARAVSTLTSLTSLDIVSCRALSTVDTVSNLHALTTEQPQQLRGVVPIHSSGDFLEKKLQEFERRERHQQARRRRPCGDALHEGVCRRLHLPPLEHHRVCTGRRHKRRPDEQVSVFNAPSFAFTKAHLTQRSSWLPLPGCVAVNIEDAKQHVQSRGHLFQRTPLQRPMRVVPTGE